MTFNVAGKVQIKREVFTFEKGLSHSLSLIHKALTVSMEHWLSSRCQGKLVHLSIDLDLCWGPEMRYLLGKRKVLHEKFKGTCSFVSIFLSSLLYSYLSALQFLV